MCFALLLLHKCETLLVVHTMPNIILKTVSLLDGIPVLTFTFHGKSMTHAMVQVINDSLPPGGFPIKHDGLVGFTFKRVNEHSFCDCNEDDVTCIILDCMEEMGYSYRFQYQEVRGGRFSIKSHHFSKK